MKKVYIITCKTEASRSFNFAMSTVEWVFTSKRTANKQLDIIKNRIENGDWWCDATDNHKYGKILRDTSVDYDNFDGVLRDVLAETPNGIHVMYRLQEKELNHGIYLTTE